MNPRIENLRGYILRKEHHVLRRTPARLGLDNLNIGFAAAGMPPVRRSAEMLAALMRAEQPVILPGEKIVFTRTVTEVPEIFTPQEWDGIKASHYIHERGTVCNISPDYETTIRLGLDARKAEIASRLADDSLDQEQRIFLGSQLTRKGLGFPQYSNDDVIVPGLMKKGYSEQDARNYVVAACWEFIIPNHAMDIPNIDAVSLIGCVREVLPELEQCPDYAAFYGRVERKIAEKADAICRKHRNLYIAPAPMMSLLMDGTIERAQDISLGSRYNNYGLHGTGIATAADSLAALRKFYFEERRFDAPTLLSALEDDFRGAPELQRLLRREAPKMGQDDDYADSIGRDLLASFARALEGRRNERGGIYRAGTGTAMYYVFHAAGLGATPDGRSAGEMIPANYSPSLFIDQRGPVSVIKSFTKPRLEDVVNGGPLTLEFDQSVFNNEESVRKLGMLVKTYIALGGHQLQLNTVSREKLLDAKVHPERHRNLIVRVWGWSGYFVELDECYQNHVIDRIEFGL